MELVDDRKWRRHVDQLRVRTVDVQTSPGMEEGREKTSPEGMSVQRLSPEIQVVPGRSGEVRAHASSTEGAPPPKAKIPTDEALSLVEKGDVRPSENNNKLPEIRLQDEHSSSDSPTPYRTAVSQCPAPPIPTAKRFTRRHMHPDRYET